MGYYPKAEQTPHLYHNYTILPWNRHTFPEIRETHMMRSMTLKRFVFIWLSTCTEFWSISIGVASMFLVIIKMAKTMNTSKTVDFISEILYLHTSLKVFNNNAGKHRSFCFIYKTCNKNGRAWYQSPTRMSV